MLPTLAERLQRQHARTRGTRARRLSHPPWPVPLEPPTALLFVGCPDLETAVEPVGPAVAAEASRPAPDPLPPLSAVVVTEIARPELAAPLPPEPAMPTPPSPARERPLLGELLLLLVWVVLVVVDGALALASLINGAACRQRRPQARAASEPSPVAAPPFLMAAAAP